MAQAKTEAAAAESGAKAPRFGDAPEGGEEDQAAAQEAVRLLQACSPGSLGARSRAWHVQFFLSFRGAAQGRGVGLPAIL
eukprot:1151201-Pelagomonas_calceolata.AAC.4